MKKCLIIGAGQLGSRHLQGMLKSKIALDVYVLDTNLKSISVAKDRAAEIESKHKLTFLDKFENLLPESFDLVIIATNANIRAKLILQLLQVKKVQFLVLEKVLFQEIASFERISKILIKNNVKTYVNHCRRMFESYQELKNELDNSQITSYNAFGGHWGLGCNALHFIDLFVFLSNSNLVELNTTGLDNAVIESNRIDYVEFTGTLLGKLANGSQISISSISDEATAVTVSIFNCSNRVVVQESGLPMIYNLEKSNQFKCEEKPFIIEYQSNLTTKIIDQLFSLNQCDLPTFDEATQSHKIFIEALLTKYNEITNLNSKILPIT